MKRLVTSLCLGVFLSLAVAQDKQASFDLAGVSVSQAIGLMYGEVMKTDFVIDPEVLSDQRLVTFRYKPKDGPIRPFVVEFLRALGYAVDTRQGIDFISKMKPERLAEAEDVVKVYRPNFRSVDFISRTLSPLFKGRFTVNRAVSAPPGATQSKDSPPESAAAAIQQESDVLVFTGSQAEVNKLSGLLPQIDFQVGEVVVRGVVYEVTTTDREGSAFGLFANLLGGKLSAGVGSVASLGSFLRFKNTALEAVYSVLSQDSRFKVMSSPSLRIKSGSQGVFSVGQDVPVLGAVSYPANGQPVQSVEYRSSGVIFNIQPTVRESLIDLDIDQQLSNFAQTTTGVNGSPTLTKRALKTSVGLQDGDLIVLGGLTENKQTETRDGPSFLPRLFHTVGKEGTRSEILLVLQVLRI
ncbi:type II secretion system protein GspD [Hydrogenophaga sp. NFH-34]|uniref:type II secretion system protein GspD n=1 Tax=Hydrogenophaga sp. NFH-34 TaxID=2744446 RepID=UPI001F1C96E5|nr:type II secretory pathway protein [Hydrogenophaga sp. NFH-34]